MRFRPLLSVLILAALAGDPSAAIRINEPAPPAKPGATKPASPAPAKPAPAKPTPATPAPAKTPPAAPAKPAPVKTTPAASTPARPPSASPVRPSDPLFAEQWNLAAIGMPTAWTRSAGAPVTVAVIDTGHTRLGELGTRFVNGPDFVSDPATSGDGDGRDADGQDPAAKFSYHGTLVAALIGAAHDGAGIAGINPRARLLAARVADANGEIRVDDLAAALRWAAGLDVPGVPRNPTPARVVNLSLFADFVPLTGCDPTVQAALDDVYAAGVTVVAGAGNDDASADGYTPAGCEHVITVAATDRAGRRAPYSNWGGSVTLAAPGGTSPGGEVLSVSPSGTARRTGTSLAAPHVTGVVSLMLGLNPKLTPDEVKAILTRTATPFPGGACDPDPSRPCGAGVLNAPAALDAARPAVPVVR